MDNLKVLGQAYPAITTLSTLYTATVQTAVSSIVVCNQATTAGTFSVSVRVAGAVDTPAQYLYFEQYLKAKSTFIATIGITLAPTDLVSIQSSNGWMSFNLFGALVS